MKLKTIKLSGWGNYPIQTCQVTRPESYHDLHLHLASGIARGQGRSYGDAALSDQGEVLLTERLNRFLDFDRQHGRLTAEAGLTLDEILQVIVPAGWFLPVTPGTRFASLGGCVAADVHGKNHHHAGSFSQYVEVLELILADGKRIMCSATEHTELFWATVGGMGLTGIIGTVTLKLIPLSSNKVWVKQYAVQHIDALFEYLLRSDIDDQYSIAWLDCINTGPKFGRGILMTGQHAQPSDLPPALQAQALLFKKRKVVNIPGKSLSYLLNPFSMKIFNQLYYTLHQQKHGQRLLVDYDRYFYPLDGLSGWNYLYGKAGFVQYQCVLPMESAVAGIKMLLQKLASANIAPFLGSLKRFGQSSLGLLSFPMPGFTLALDISLRSPIVLQVLQELDAIVLEHQGRIYLAKDACLKPEVFRQMYPQYATWQKVKQHYDPQQRFCSRLARRLELM